MRIHLSLPTTSLERSVAFYSALLKAEPLKYYDDYALFVADDPGLELALVPESTVDVAAHAHFGIAVDDTGIVDEAASRLRAAGLSVDVERDETCCYAKQNKVWAKDPDGRRWEIYHVLAETEEHQDATRACCSEAICDTYAICCAT